MKKIIIVIILLLLIVSGIYFISNKSNKPKFSSPESMKLSQSFDDFSEILSKYEKMKMTKSDCPQAMIEIILGARSLKDATDMWESSGLNFSSEENKYFADETNKIGNRERAIISKCQNP